MCGRAAWVEATFDRLSGGQVLAGARRWLELVAWRGPTHRNGPLTHDWLLPSAAAPSQVGVNVFSEDAASSARVREALSTAAKEITAAPGAFVVDDDEIRFHGGMVWRGGQGVVKAYITGPTSALQDLAYAQRVTVDDDVFAIGFDVTARGVERARSYRRAHTVEHAWEGYLRWAALEPAGLSHRVVATLAPPHAPVGKRSYDHIFGPEASLDALHELAADVADIVDCAPSYEVSTLAEVQQALPDALVLRPVSYEFDLFDDGRRHTDALVTVGERT